MSLAVQAAPAGLVAPVARAAGAVLVTALELALFLVDVVMLTLCVGLVLPASLARRRWRTRHRRRPVSRRWCD